MKPNHINTRKLWEYINFKAELNQDEHVHMAECSRCFETFKLCVLADTPEAAERDRADNDRSSKKSA